jgi:hypothetical protein
MPADPGRTAILLTVGQSAARFAGSKNFLPLRRDAQ